LIKHQGVQEFTSICAKKSDLGTADKYIWLISFQNGTQGSYTWWWCTTKKSKQKHLFVFM